jgi:membrane associated rhomboid family serine protease
MSYQASEEQGVPRITPAVQWLISLNVLVYFLQLTIIKQEDMRAALGFELSSLVERPWTVFTYMFVHAGFLHLASNMYALWLFGSRLERAWSPGSFTRYYLLCGLGGWLAYVMFFRHAGYLIGASAGVYGVMLAYAMRWPNDEMILFPLFIPVKVKWVVIGLCSITAVAGIASLNAAGGAAGGVAYAAHFGGLATGWLYLRWISATPSLDSLRQRVSHIPDLPEETPRAIPRAHPRPRERAPEVDEVVARSNQITARRTAGPTLTSKVGKARTDALNDVLDKISREGLGSLTSEERRLLEEVSRRLRDS